MPFLANTPVEKMTGPYIRRWWALLVLCLSLLIVVMANTSLIVAAPDMTIDLGLSSSDLQWVVDGYTVPYAALMLVLGSIGDKYSRRGALVTGLVIFAGGSVMGSLVDETSLVIAARAIMGVGAAVVIAGHAVPAGRDLPPERAGQGHHRLDRHVRSGHRRRAAGGAAGCWRTTPGARRS